MLLPYLEQDEALRDHFFSNLDTIFYAAAALPQNLWDRIESLSIATRGEKIAMTSAWGSTETAPLATSVHFPIDRAGVLGVPIPGTELKMLPNAGKLEIRVRGPNVTPGYFQQTELTKDVFDEEGFYLIGDAAKLADEKNPSKGVIFDGRVAEDFKLSTGTWVSVGTLRPAIVTAGAPLIMDVVVAGHNGNEIGLLIFIKPNIAAELAGLPLTTPLSEMITHESIRNMLRKALQEHNKVNPASSTRIRRILLLPDQPNIDANEITDKGYLNQCALLERRADDVQALFTDDDRIIYID